MLPIIMGLQFLNTLSQLKSISLWGNFPSQSCITHPPFAVVLHDHRSFTNPTGFILKRFFFAVEEAYEERMEC